MRTIALFGDSMLARFNKGRIDLLEREIGADTVVVNCAAGGWTSADGVRRAGLVARMDPDIVVLSFGANDCAPGRHIGLDAFTANIRSIVATLARPRILGFLPPSVVEHDGVGPRGRTNAVLDAYRAALRAAVAGQALDSDAALAPLRADGVTVQDDGLHLNGPAYRTVIIALARHVTAGQGAPGR